MKTLFKWTINSKGTQRKIIINQAILSQRSNQHSSLFPETSRRLRKCCNFICFQRKNQFHWLERQLLFSCKKTLHPRKITFTSEQNWLSQNSLTIWWQIISAVLGLTHWTWRMKTRQQRPLPWNYQSLRQQANTKLAVLIEQGSKVLRNLHLNPPVLEQQFAFFFVQLEVNFLHAVSPGPVVILFLFIPTLSRSVTRKTPGSVRAQISLRSRTADSWPQQPWPSRLQKSLWGAVSELAKKDKRNFFSLFVVGLWQEIVIVQVAWELRRPSQPQKHRTCRKNCFWRIWPQLVLTTGKLAMANQHVAKLTTADVLFRYDCVFFLRHVTQKKSWEQIDPLINSKILNKSGKQTVKKKFNWETTTTLLRPGALQTQPVNMFACQGGSTGWFGPTTLFTSLWNLSFHDCISFLDAPRNEIFSWPSPLPWKKIQRSRWICSIIFFRKVQLTSKHGSIASDFRPTALEKADISRHVEVQFVRKILYLTKKISMFCLERKDFSRNEKTSTACTRLFFFSWKKQQQQTKQMFFTYDDFGKIIHELSVMEGGVIQKEFLEHGVHVVWTNQRPQQSQRVLARLQTRNLINVLPIGFEVMLQK